VSFLTDVDGRMRKLISTLPNHRSRSFSTEGTEYKWKPGTETIPTEHGENEDSTGVINGKTAGSGYSQGRKIWRCVTTQQFADKHPARPGGAQQMSDSYPRNTYPASQSADHASNGHAPTSHPELSVSLPYMSGTNDEHSVHQSASTNDNTHTQDLASASMLYPVDTAALSYPSPTTPITAAPTILDPIVSSGNDSHPHHADRSVPGAISQAPLFKSIIPTSTSSQFLLACLVPPQPTGPPQGELALFPHLFPSWSSSLPPDSSSFNEHHPVLSSSSSKLRDLRMLETLLLSAILLLVNKGEWTYVQSPVNPIALQAVFMAEAKGEVPPYTPGPTGARRAAQRHPYPRIDTRNSESSPRDTETINGRARGRANSGPLERPRINLAEHARLANARHPKSAGDGAYPQPSDSPIAAQRRQSHRNSPSSPSSPQGPDTNPFPTPPFAFLPRGFGSRRGHGRASIDVQENDGSGIRPVPTTASHSRAGDGFFNSRRPSTSHGRPRNAAVESGSSNNQAQNELVVRNRSTNRVFEFPGSSGSKPTRSRPSSSGGRRPSTVEVRAGDGFFSTGRRAVDHSNDRESARPATTTLFSLSYSQDAPVPPTRSPPPTYDQFTAAERQDRDEKG
jgi:hypothetical protein